MFSNNGTNGSETSTTSCLKDVRQVAVPVRRQTVFGRLNQSAGSEAKCAMCD